MKVGDLVRWSSNGEMGIVVECHNHSFRVCWLRSDRAPCGYAADHPDIEVINESR
jgi:hypothetical protein